MAQPVNNNSNISTSLLTRNTITGLGLVTNLKSLASSIITRVRRATVGLANFIFTCYAHYVQHRENQLFTKKVTQTGEGVSLKTLAQGALLIKGDLDLSRINIKSFPDDLTINGNLTISTEQFNLLSKKLTVKGSLKVTRGEASELAVVKVPKQASLTVGKNLEISTNFIHSLPDHLTVGGDMDLMNKKIAALPSHLTVDGQLLLVGTQIDSWPENFNMTGRLDLTGAKLCYYDESSQTTVKSSLPKTMTISQGLRLAGENMQYLPNHCTINSNVAVSSNKMKFWPEHLTVNGNMEIRTDQEEPLPKNLTLNGELDLLDISKMRTIIDNGDHLNQEVKSDDDDEDFSFGISGARGMMEALIEEGDEEFLADLKYIEAMNES